MMLLPTQALLAAPEVAELEPDSTPWMSVLLAFFLIVLIGLGSFKSGKRTHLD